MRLELTRRADYAIRASLALAGAGDELFTGRRLAAQQRIPVGFLPRVMSDLVRAGLVDAVSGRAGGYRLARPAASVSLLDIIEAVEGDVRRRTCVLRGGACGVSGASGVCDVHAVFSAGQDDLLDRLSAARLASPVHDPRAPAREGPVPAAGAPARRSPNRSR